MARPVVTERAPSPAPNTTDTTSQQTPWARRTESSPPPAPNTATVVNQWRAPRSQQAGPEQPTLPAPETVSATGKQKAPWARQVANEVDVTSMSPDRKASGDNVKDTSLAENATKEPAPIRPVDDKSSPHAEGKAISEPPLSLANGSNLKQSFLSRSFRKPPPPPPAPKAGTSHVAPWVRSTAHQPNTHAPAKKETNWSRSGAPSPPGGHRPTISGEQVIRSPSWTRTDKKEVPQSPPSSPSRGILNEIKTRRKPEKLEVSDSASQNHAEPETSDDGANIVVSYGGAIIETPKSVNVASLSCMFSSGGSARRPRSRSTPPTTRRSPKSWVDQPASPVRNGTESVSPPSQRFTSSVDSSRGRSLQRTWSKQDTSNGQLTSVRSPPALTKPGASNGQSSSVASTQPSWAKRDKGSSGQSGSTQSSQPSWRQRDPSRNQLNQVQSPPPSWVNRDMSQKESSSIQSPQPALMKPSNPQDRKSAAAMSWLTRSKSQGELNSIKSPQLRKSARLQHHSFRSSPPSWVDRSIAQEEISPINSPPLKTEEGLWEEELSAIQSPQMSQTKSARFPASTQMEPSNAEAQSLENVRSASVSAVSRTSISNPSEESWWVEARPAEGASQWDEPDDQVEDANAFDSHTKSTSGEAPPSAEHLSTLSQQDFDESKDYTPPASDLSPFNSPTLAQMAADSVYAIDYELMMAQARNEENTEDEEVSLVSSGVGKSIPNEGELPEEVKAMLDMNRSNVSSRHYDDSRAHEADFVSTEGSSSGVNKSGSSLNSTKDVSASSQGSSIPRLSPSKKDVAHSSPRRTTKLLKKVLEFDNEETPVVLKESREMSARILERMSALDITVDDEETPARILERMSALDITVSEDRASDASVVFGDPDMFGEGREAAKEQAPSVPERTETIEGWQEPISIRDDSGLFASTLANSMNFANDCAIDLHESPVSPRPLGTRTALLTDFTSSEEVGGHKSVPFSDRMSFEAAGENYAAESEPSVLHRGHAINEWKDGHVVHPRRAPRIKESSSAEGAKHVLQYFSHDDEPQDSKSEASQLEHPEEWAGLDADGIMGPGTSPTTDAVDPQKIEEMDALKDWHFTNVPPHETKKSNAQDPFFQQGDPFAMSNIAAGAVDFKAFDPFTEDETAAEFFSPYGEEPPRGNAARNLRAFPQALQTGNAARKPRPARQTSSARVAPSPTKLAPSRRDRGVEYYDYYYAQQARSANPFWDNLEI